MSFGETGGALVSRNQLRFSDASNRAFAVDWAARWAVSGTCENRHNGLGWQIGGS